MDVAHRSDIRMRSAGFLFSLGLLFSAVTAMATSFVERPFSEAVQEAPVIARGQVGMTYTDWGFDQTGTRHIYTYVELQVSEVLKGEAATPSLMMRELGGEKDGVGMQVSGSAKFERGEDVVVFLGQQNPDGSFNVHGMMMAKLNVIRGENGEETLKGPALGFGSGHVHREKGKGQDDTTGVKKWTLAGLKNLIREQGDAPTELQAHDISRNEPIPAATGDAESLSEESDGRPAPALQPIEEGDVGASTGQSRWWMIAGAIVAAVLTLLFLRRRRP